MLPRDDRFLQDLFHFVFDWFDSEPDYTGDQAGELATKIQTAAETEIYKLLNDIKVKK